MKQPTLALTLLSTLLGFATFVAGQSSTIVSRPQAVSPGKPSAAAASGASQQPNEIRIGKFEILATFTYARALRDGLSDSDAKQRAIVAAVMGARARGVRRGGTRAPAGAKASAKHLLTASSYDEQIAARLRPFYDATFLPTMKRLVQARLTYKQIKELLNIPPDVGAKITAKAFEEKTAAYLQASKSVTPP